MQVPEFLMYVAMHWPEFGKLRNQRRAATPTTHLQHEEQCGHCKGMLQQTLGGRADGQRTEQACKSEAAAAAGGTQLADQQFNCIP